MSPLTPLCRYDAISPEACLDSAVFRLTVVFQIELQGGALSREYMIEHHSCYAHVNEACSWYGLESPFWPNMLLGKKLKSHRLEVDALQVLELQQLH